MFVFQFPTIAFIPFLTPQLPTAAFMLTADHWLLTTAFYAGSSTPDYYYNSGVRNG